ncbi:sensor histidine kinase N-terminal domain-containing protein [Luteimonas sp. SJ-92]|uniref:histidine kinase n=1 Tax=Luteimonas salinisoli TaxID=2752307 RepID=A0A853JG80_9GAMM|nr:ATP-binding protein [Luteimonas salinisoli]NZA27855.1 sensor histidine kinase N-terminal domain-containing protein [Luteimonas salinisoli]
MLRFLLVPLGLLIAVAGWFSYKAGLQEAGEIFDARLVQSTRVLVSLVDEPLSELNAYPGEPLVLRGWHGEAHGVGEALAFDDGHAYENKLAFQVWDADGRLLLRSDSAPTTPLAGRAPGYADVAVDGAHWRVFTLRSPQGRWFQSAELSDIREELAADIAGGTLLPLLLSVPLMILAIWWSVAAATRSLRRMSHEIGQREPERLVPLDPAQVPREARGLIVAINGLLQRLDAALARERRFVADAAHELRTPISALKVHADNARQAHGDGERLQSERLLAESIERVERLAAQLLSLSRAENPGGMEERTRLDLDALVRAEVEELRLLADRKGQVLAITLEGAQVRGDEFTLGLLVRNLVENAVRYTPAGGSIEVSTSRAGAHAMLSVEDSGPGIPEEDRERVFDRFYRRLESGHDGSGLGLAIAREATASHGGSIRLDRSDRLGGLAVHVLLPAMS